MKGGVDELKEEGKGRGKKGRKGEWGVPVSLALVEGLELDTRMRLCLRSKPGLSQAFGR